LARVQVPIPSTIRLGCVDTPSSPDCDSDEKAFSPDSATNLQSFEIAATETPWGAYRRCVNDGSCAEPLWLKAPPTDDYPVTDIDWENAQRFCRWVGGRLPTEIEWELAARHAEKASPRDIPLATMGRRVCCAANASVGPSKIPPTADASQDSPEISDMLGNVAEWTASVYRETLDSTANEIPATAPLEPVTLRGGSWMHPPEMARVSARQALPATMSLGTVGFRCVWALNQRQE
jgi:formylglycine-generating enzyme required for sulfatase activity